MMLAERGRLSRDDEMWKYLPEMPDYGSPLTIRHPLALSRVARSGSSGLDRDAYTT
jgi:hypothetical protein